jgi:hypothetical protein
MFNFYLWSVIYLYNYNYVVFLFLISIFLVTIYFFFENIKEIVTDYIYDISSYNKIFQATFLWLLVLFFIVFYYYSTL